MTYCILAGSYSDSIFTLSFDPTLPPSSALTLLGKCKVGHHPSWITSHPSDRSLVFTGLEQTEGKIVTIRFDKSGRGEIVGEGPSGGADPCAIRATEDELYVSNYSSGTFAVFPLSLKPPYLPSSPSSHLAFTGTGTNPERQEASHLHDVVLVGSDEILVPDLGADKVWRLSKSADGKWAQSGHVDCPPGSGPRHALVHDGILYTLFELSSQLSSARLSPVPSDATVHSSSTSTMANPPSPLGEMLAAEILIPQVSSEFSTAYAYVSNRNDPSPGGDSIAIFATTGEEPPKRVGEVRTRLKHLRGMAFGGEGDKYLVAGGSQGGGVRVFERVDGGRGLKLVAENEGIESTTSFLWM